MIRKIVMASAVALVPVAAVTTVGLSGVASAKGKTPPAAITCTLGGSITFQSPGLSTNGQVGKVKTSTSVVSTTATGSGCASGLTNNVTEKTSKCTGTNLGQGGATITGCAKGEDYWDQSGALVSGGTASIAAALKKGINTTDTGVPVNLQVPSTGVTTVLPSGTGACGSSDAGFQIKGTVKKSTVAYTITLCLSGDTGTGTTGAFVPDLLHSVSGGSYTGMDIATATIDPTLSSLVIS